MYNDIYSKANHTIQKVTKTYSSVPCRVMKAHALPDHNFVAFMTLGLVKRNHIIPLKSLPKQLPSYEIRTVTQLCRALCLPTKYFLKFWWTQIGESTTIFWGRMSRRWMGVWLLAIVWSSEGKMRIFSVRSPPTVQSPLYSFCMVHPILSTIFRQSCKSQVHPRSPRAWPIPWPARGS